MSELVKGTELVKSSEISRYYFEEILHCEMCGNETAGSRIMGQRLNQSQGLNPRQKTGISVSVVKCRKCGLIFNQPMPIPFDIQDHYGTPPESYWQESYFNETPDYFSGQLKFVGELLGDVKGKRALDIGAGLGKCMIALEKAGYEAHGFEPSKPFYERAISKMGIARDKLRLGMMEAMEYEESMFDFITFGAVLEHLYHPAKSIERALKWLKPGGIIHIEVPSSKHLVGRLFNIYYKLRFTNYVTNTSPMHVPFHLYEFSIKSFTELGKKLKYQLERSQIDVCEIMHLPKFLHPFLRAYMKWTQTGMQLTVYLRKISAA